MNNLKCLHLTVVFAVASLVAARADDRSSPGSPKGTAILHWHLTQTFPNEGGIPAAGGRLDLKQNQQGKANVQRLDLTLHGLAGQTTYQLLSRRVEETNLTQVTTFQTDPRGAARLRYQLVEAGKNKSRGKGKLPLENPLHPLSALRELTVADASTQAVLRAELIHPDRMQILIKRLMTNDGVETNAWGWLHIKATTREATVAVKAGGLSMAADYSLALNDGIVTSAHTSTNTTAQFKVKLVNPLDILETRTIRVLDAATNSVLSATLP